MYKIEEVIHSQKYDLDVKLKEKYIERETKLKYLDKDIIKVIIGPRRAGKSFFAIHTLSRYGKFIYINFDDEYLISCNDMDSIINSATSIYGETKTIFIDEVQNYPKWELTVNRLQRKGYNIILSGSNSNLLSSGLATHLTGRHYPVYIFPFTYKEFLKIHNAGEFEERNLFLKYLNSGGYPEPLLKSYDIKDYLGLLFDSILYKDIVKRNKIRKDTGIINITNHLISNISNEFSYRTLTRISEVKNPTTINRYLSYIENSFLIFCVNRFSFKSKLILSSPGKIYCGDNGFIISRSLSVNKDRGKLFENVAAIKLMIEKIKGNIDFHYWQSADKKSEADFVVIDKLKNKTLIQVCSDITDDKTKMREIRGLLNAGNKLDIKNLYILTDGFEAKEKHKWFGNECDILFIPVWKWMKGF